MSEELLLGIGNMLKKKIASSQSKRKLRPVFSVFVEQMQTVLQISAERDHDGEDSKFSYGVIAMGEAGYNVFIACGNIIHTADALSLKKQLDFIKGLDPAGLKNLWKRSLKDAIPGDPGLNYMGFINIARRAKGGIEYEFVRINPKWVFFTFKAFI